MDSTPYRNPSTRTLSNLSNQIHSNGQHIWLDEAFDELDRSVASGHRSIRKVDDDDPEEIPQIDAYTELQFE